MATVYLSPTGDDSRSYATAQNSATPWATLGKVNSSATTGDTVEMAAGTYSAENVTFGKNFTINGAALSNGRPTTIINSATTNKQWTLTGRTVSISRIWFDNVASADGYFYFGVGAGGLTVTNCYFSITGGMYGSVLSLTTTSATATFTSCVFYVNTASAIILFSLYAPGSAVLLSLYNNVFYLNQFNTTYGIVYLLSANAGLTAKNNIMQNQSGVSARFTYNAGSAPTPTISYNCFYAGSGAITFDVGSSVNGITSDPLFVDPANGNFNLRPTSPCLDAGTLI